jgi:hypothetical protein
MTVQEQPRLADNLRLLLARLRRGVRRYVLVEGLAATLVVMVLAFWAALAIDWLFEPPRAARIAMLAGGALAAGWVLLRLVLARLLVPLSDRSLALVLERRYRDFEDGLLTAVELTAQPRLPAEALDHGRQMLAHTCRQASAKAGRVHLADVFDPAPLKRALIAAGLLAASLVVFALAAPAAFLLGVQRLAAVTDQPWPRRTHLLIEDFKNNEKVVARGTDLEVLVRAKTERPLVVPRVVQVRYSSDEGRRERKNMVREGSAVAGRDPFQDFKYTFQSVLSNIRFDVLGGDARISDLRIRVVDSPTISMVLACRYPDYIGRLPAEMPASGVVALPRGTHLTVKARANKDLISVQVDYMADPDTAASDTIALAEERQFEFVLDRLDFDQTLSFTMLDTDGIRNRQPVQLALVATPDEPPQVALRLEGIGSAVTPQARLPIAGRITDDYGIAQTWVEYTIDEQPSRQQPLAAAAGRTELAIDEAFEIGPLDLKPGQKLLVGTKAADNHSLPGNPEPNLGQGERFLLDVVTSEALRAILEGRELNLRQRFETIIEEVTDSRDSLAALELGDSSAEPVALPDPLDDPADAPLSPQQVLSRRTLRVQRVRQNGEKNAEETRGIAISFDGIRAELVNNRVDTEELRMRLEDNIARPLKEIADAMFPELERRLEQLQRGLPAEASALQAKQAAVEQMDAILVRMLQVRDKMLELETFNEAVQLLREIVAAQKEVTEQTRKERLEKVKSLLEDEDIDDE